MRKFFGTYAAAAAAFCLGFLGTLGFMTASFAVEMEASPVAAGGAVGQNSGETARPVLVIDAGHGGFDGGARAADGTEEKTINLEIALKLAEAAAAYPVDVVLTRESDTGLYTEGNSGSKKREDLLKRKEIMEAADPVLAVSIHLNSFPQDVSVYGAQVFYAPSSPEVILPRTDEQTGEQRKADSRNFAESVQKALELHIPDGRERTAMAKSDILLMKDPACPVILVECGFLSNPDEAERLKTSEYQGQLASAIWEGINEILCLQETVTVPVVDSTNRHGNEG